jgi:dienelactone hydrolase
VNPTDGGGANASKCGAPLDSTAPTAASIVKDGPYSVTSYSTGLPSSSAYKSLTVFYPTNASGPYVVVMVSPGLTEILLYLTPWTQRFASYGYVAVFVEANDTNNDSEATRADGLWAAIGAIKGENTRAGSPLAGKLSGCIVTSGHSLGGGASFTIANSHPGDVTGALGFNPYDPTTNFSSIVVPTLVLTGQNDPTAPPAQHGRRQYDSMSTTLPKEYVEIAGGNHQAALAPATIPGQYAVSWIKAMVDGDMRYRPFLDKAASGLSDFATTLP